MKTSKKPSKSKKFSYRLGEAVGTVAGVLAGTFATPPSAAQARSQLDKKGRAKLKAAKTSKKRP